jgi:prepilin-type N-terminal cleavage/methylation domain-containing protein
LKHYNKMTRQAGMTLIELAVVLLILIGLSGLLIPYVSGFMEKTHDSTSVATIAELNNTIQRHQTTHMRLPSDLESLYDGTGVYDRLQQTAYLTTLAAPAANGDAGDLANASLAKAGIKAVFNNDPATTDATFQSTTGAAVPLDNNGFNGTGIPLVILQGNPNGGDQSFFGQLSAGLQATTGARANGLTNADPELKNQLIYAFGGNEDSWDTACTNYVVMGIGSANTLIPSSMQSAPLMFGSNGDEAPKDKYARYLAVFAVPSSAGGGCTSDGANVTAPNADAAARFIGAAADMTFPALVGLNGAQQWSNNNLAKN